MSSPRISRLAAPLLGLALAPTAVGTFLAAGKVLGSLVNRGAATSWFLVGFGSYLLGHALGLWRFRRAYVFAHELTHALAAACGGARIFGFSVGKESGHVDLSHISVFSALAPYWLPLYT
jgi:hypothetical protein